MEKENSYDISFFTSRNESASSNSSPILKKKPKYILPISPYDTPDMKLKKSSLQSVTFSPFISEKSYPSICSTPSPILGRKSKFILPVGNYGTFKKDSNKIDSKFARSSTPLRKSQKRSDKKEEIKCCETYNYVEPGIIILHKGQLSPNGNKVLPQNVANDEIELIPRDIISTHKITTEVRVSLRERPISLPTITEISKKNVVSGKEIIVDLDNVSIQPCSSKSSETMNFFEPNEKKSNKQNIPMDVNALNKKVRLWFDKFYDTNNTIVENLNKKESIEKIRSTKHAQDERPSVEQIIYEANKNRPSSDIQRKSSFEPEYIDVLENETKSIELSSIQVSPMRSGDVSSSELSFGDPTRDSSIGYVSSTTTLFDIVLNPELDYTIKTLTDVTGDEDYYTVFDRRYQKEIEEKERKKHELQQRLIEEQRARRENFKSFNINKITWTEFGPDKIKFNIMPKDIYPAYFSSKRKYVFSIVYNGRFWQIKTFRVPEYEIILNMCKKCDMKDESIEIFLKFVVKVILRHIKLEKKFKVKREKDYFAGKDIDLNDSDIELLLNEEERKEYKERQERNCKRMMVK